MMYNILFINIFFDKLYDNRTTLRKMIPKGSSEDMKMNIIFIIYTFIRDNFKEKLREIIGEHFVDLFNKMLIFTDLTYSSQFLKETPN